jgi:hypothetical protein
MTNYIKKILGAGIKNSRPTAQYTSYPINKKSLYAISASHGDGY